MTGKINDGGPAFPVSMPALFGRDAEGMSLRDWFAGQALAGLLSNPRADQEWAGKHAAVSAYNVADAMLAARAKGGAQ